MGEEESEDDSDDEDKSIDNSINDEIDGDDDDEEEVEDSEQDPTFYYRINNLQSQQTVPPSSKSTSWFKMHSMDELSHDDYHKGSGYVPKVIISDLSFIIYSI